MPRSAPPGDAPLLAALPGGSPANVAVGAARLGRATAFVGVLSDDGFGRMLRDHLVAESVDLAATRTSASPTTLAVVHLDATGTAAYRFYLEGTAAAIPVDADGEVALPAGALLHVSFGALAATTAPAGQALAALIGREHGRRLVCLDPNVRPIAVGPVDAYVEVLDGLVRRTDLVKVSAEDLATLAPGRDVLDTAARWAADGPALVVVTRGEDGAVALRPSGGRIAVGAPRVTVADTVGAGDAFTAGLLCALVERGVRTRDALAALADDDVAAVLTLAARAAAITCERVGADPPRRSELGLGLAP